jgi:pimeloyl-ACP methyl ester carboxylesterase
MSGVERIDYDEFGLFHENADEYGLPYAGPPTVRRDFVDLPDHRRLSALVWGTSDPELVFLHGGGQNAHTWDTVAMAIGRPLLAVDLPGHGHSDAGRESSLSLESNVEDVATAIGALAPNANGVVGMSLGGMTTLALAGSAPELVRAAVLVDVTPGVNRRKSTMISDFLNGPLTFTDFDEILARTIEYNPTRTVSSLRRGILHNAEQLEDGGWVWRHQDDHGPVEGGVGLSVPTSVKAMPPAGLAGPSRYRTDAANLGEGSLVADTTCVVPGRDEHLGGDVEPDAEGLQELRRSGFGQCLEMPGMHLDLFMEIEPPSSK